MAVTTSQIRDLLNRPRGLNEATISEYITIRTAEINKRARSDTTYRLSDTTGVTDTIKESAIKFLVCCDCLRVMIDTIPTYVPEPEQRRTDIRLRQQLGSMEKRADELVMQVVEAPGSAFSVGKTATRQESS